MANWFICNTVAGTQREIEPGNAESEIKAIAEDALPFTHIWMEGWANWRPLPEIPELMRYRKVMPPPIPLASPTPAMPPALPPPYVMPIQAAPVVGPVAPVVIKPAFQERRRHPRQALRLRVVVVSNSIVFRTFTNDCSMGGICLEHPVPRPMLGVTVECYISRPDMQSGLRFQARLVADSVATDKELIRFQFIDQDPRSQSILEEWFRDCSKVAA